MSRRGRRAPSSLLAPIIFFHFRVWYLLFSFFRFTVSSRCTTNRFTRVKKTLSWRRHSFRIQDTQEGAEFNRGPSIQVCVQCRIHFTPFEANVHAKTSIGLRPYSIFLRGLFVFILKWLEDLFKYLLKWTRWRYSVLALCCSARFFHYSFQPMLFSSISSLSINRYIWSDRTRLHEPADVVDEWDCASQCRTRFRWHSTVDNVFHNSSCCCAAASCFTFERIQRSRCSHAD